MIFSIGTLTDNKQTKIKKGQYLVLNDNRRDTEDSRKFGLIEKDQIKGVISFRVYPLSRFGFVVWINISIPLKKLETYQKSPAFLVVLVLAMLLWKKLRLTTKKI